MTEPTESASQAAEQDIAGYIIPRPSVDDFRALDWQASLNGVALERMYQFEGLFANKAQSARESNDERAERVFQSLADACSLRPRLDDVNHPFSARAITQTFRSPGVDDISDEAVAAFTAIAAGVQNLRLRARLADVAWVRSRDAGAARTAVEAYLSIAERISPADWTTVIHDVERAAQIGAHLGRGNAEMTTVASFIERHLAAVADTDNGFMSAKLMAVLHEYGAGDPEGLFASATAFAARAATARVFHRARVYYELAAKWARRRKVPLDARASILAAAETYVTQANDLLSQETGSRLVAATHLQHAVEALRSAGRARDRIEEVMALLVEVQSQAMAELRTHSVKMDVTDAVTNAERAVSDRGLTEALLVLAAHVAPPSVERLRETALDHAERFLAHSFFPKVIISAEGKTIARAGSVKSSDTAEREGAIRADMFELAARQHGVSAQISIDPMRRRIVNEHPLRIDDLTPFIINNPFVPTGRERLYAEALYAGFYGDLPKAVHLIVPQLEHSVRVLLYRHGVRVSGLDKYGIQREFNINNLLYEPTLKEILGEDTVFALQGLLVEKYGSDIRNRMAHGLMDDGDFYTWPALYLWWLTFRLCLLPIFTRLSREAAQVQTAAASEPEQEAGEPAELSDEGLSSEAAPETEPNGGP